MPKNVTIRLDEAIVKKCRHAVVEEDKSLSQWIADVLVKVISAHEVKCAVRERALRRLEEGISLRALLPISACPGRGCPRQLPHDRFGCRRSGRAG